MNVILGLDLSLVSTGFQILDVRDPNNHFGGAIVPKKLDGIERLNYLREHLEDVLHHAKTTVAVIEGYSYGSNQSRAHSIGEWGGIARLVLFQHDIRILVIPPQTLKQFICGVGNAKKEDVKLWVYKRYKQEFRSNDVCDAYALAVMGLARINREEYVRRFRKLSDIQEHALTKTSDYFLGSSLENCRRRSRD